MRALLFLLVVAAANGTYLLWAAADRRRMANAVRRRLAFKRHAPAAQRQAPLLAPAATGARATAYRLLARLRLDGRLRELLEQAGNPTDAPGVLRRAALAGAAGFAAALVVGRGGMPVALAAGAACALLPLWLLRRAAARRLMRIEEQLPSCLEFIGRSMRAGHAFTVALELIPQEFPDPLGGEFRRVWEEHSLGMPAEAALRKLASRAPLLSVRFFVCAVSLQTRTGGNLAEILDKLAEIVRERFKLRARVRVISAHGRMTAAALSLIPVCVAGLMSVVNRPYMRFFVEDPKGLALVTAAAALQISGYLVIRHMVKIEV